MDPLSAFSKATGWAVPDFSLESRRRKHAHTLPDLAFAPPPRDTFRPPDEEKGRAFRSHSQSNSASTLFAPPGPASSKEAPTDDAVIEHLASELAHTLELDAADDDDLFEAWHADGGAKAHGDSGFVEHDPPSSRPRTASAPALSASTVWTRAIDHAVLNADGNIQLSGQKLGVVPNAVWELSTLRSFTPSSPSRTLSRTQSVPAPDLAASPTSHRVFGRTSTVSFGSPSTTAPLAAATVGVVLMLSGNELTTASLSNALWTLPNLQVLSLRNNLLDVLPEGIGRLTGLRELSLAQNQLRFLPAEILQLENLANLTLHPNPFLAPPALPADVQGAPSVTSASLPRVRRRRRVLGPLVTHFTVPSLAEICTRILLSEVAPTASAPTSLSASTSRAATTRHIQHVRGGVETLRAVLPAPLFAPFQSTFYPPSSLASSSSSSSSFPAFFSRTRQPSASAAAASAQPFDPQSHLCRSPAHPDQPRVFVHPAVERLEWVSQARLRAGQAARTPEGVGVGVGEGDGEVRDVPIRWRGCSARCLDWLEEDEGDGEGGSGGGGGGGGAAAAEAGASNPSAVGQRAR
ncbi:hypothetical protein JCM3770_002622 [Rhodotorula araucariae]